MSKQTYDEGDDTFKCGATVPWKFGPVRIVAIAEGYAMVRRMVKRGKLAVSCYPFVVSMKELRDIAAEAGAV